MTPPPARPPRLHFMCNGLFCTGVGGGDTYLSQMARSVQDPRFGLHFFGGHALQKFLGDQGLRGEITLTDERIAIPGNPVTLGEQLRLLADFAGRYRRTLPLLPTIEPQDTVYAMSDFWFDAIPLHRCRARRKILYFGMTAPSWGEIVRRSRPDVAASRLTSVYYRWSQSLAIRCAKRMKNAAFTYSHPDIGADLQARGLPPASLVYVPNGIDFETAQAAAPQEICYDAAWVGRIHPQKGIDDLVFTLDELARSVPGFRALVIGSGDAYLRPIVERMGLAAQVAFAGRVPEKAKFELLKSCRVFLMPSRYESWGIVVGEALACGLAVVAYDLACYRPVFRDTVRYVPCFDRAAFVAEARQAVEDSRAGRARQPSEAVLRPLDWKVAQARFRSLIEDGLGD